MMSFADEPAGLMTACRRMVARQPESGAQVTLAARMLTAPNARRAAWDTVDELDEDETAKKLVDLLPDDASVCVVGWPHALAPFLSRRGDIEVMLVNVSSGGWGLAERLIDQDIDAIDIDAPGLGTAARSCHVTVIEAVAASEEEALVPIGSLAAAAVAHASGREVWLATGAGTVVPSRMWDGLIGRYEQKGEPWDLDYETMPLRLVSQIHGPAGVLDAEAIMKHSSCPIAPELFS